MAHAHVQGTLRTAILLTAGFFLLELAGGFLSGSLSLLGDAGHMLRDVFALVASLGAMRIAERLPTKTRTFGYHRLEIFAAFVNSLLLVGVSGWLGWEALQRLRDPRPVASGLMLAVAVVGLLVNAWVAMRLHGHHDLNVRSAFLHVLGDALSSLAVIAAAVWIQFTGQTAADPLLGLIIAVVILCSTLSVIRDSMRILLEFTPRDLDFDEVVRCLEEVEGVAGVHNVHLWSLCSNVNLIDAHVYTPETDMCRVEAIKRRIKERLERFNIRHATLEFECEECPDRCGLGEVRH